MVDNNKEAELPAIIILRRDLRGPFHAKLAEDQYGAHGISYNHEQFPDPPEKQGADREIDMGKAIVAKYRAAIITRLLEDGSVKYTNLEQELSEQNITIPFFPEAYRQAYKEVFEFLSGLKAKPDE